MNIWSNQGFEYRKSLKNYPKRWSRVWQIPPFWRFDLIIQQICPTYRASWYLGATHFAHVTIWPRRFANYFGQMKSYQFHSGIISFQPWNIYIRIPEPCKNQDSSGFISWWYLFACYHLSSKNPHGFPPPFEAPSVVEASCKRAMTWGAMNHNHGALVCDQVTGDSSERKPWSAFVIRGICSIISISSMYSGQIITLRRYRSP